MARTMMQKKVNSEVLLETTIQIHRIVDDPSVKTRINSELHGKIVYTTTFVLREFIRTIITDIAYVHSITRRTGISDGRIALSAITYLLAQGHGRYSPRAARREQYVMAAIQSYFAETTVPIAKLLCLLDMTAHEWIDDFFKVPVGGGSNRAEQIQCLQALDSPTNEMENWLRQQSTIPTNPPCPNNAPEFLRKHLVAMVEVEKQLADEAVRHRDLKLLEMLRSFKKESGQYDFGKLNRRNIWGLGDLFITLETPAGTAIYTTDRHYEALCSATGRQRHSGYLPRESLGSGSGSRETA
jgi:hypothetical protein